PTSAPTTPPSTAATGTAPARSTPARLVLGPKGYGALKLGMSREAASATGLIDSWKTSGTSGCIGYTHLKANTGDEGSVLYSTATGIVVIDAPSNAVRTPEGIHIGSSVAAVLKAYPDWEPAEADGPGADGRGWAPVPGNRDAYYRMMIQGGKVTDLTLQHKNQDCYE
ncbi:MAG TPA: hypothetical protein VFW27_31035, partial [Actinoplanes sp.]|nr:hypothetical protein [Actinoplanes sp.]